MKQFSKYFWHHVHKTKDCWIWTASKSKSGYGKTSYHENNKLKSIETHRASWEIEYGLIPRGICVLHRCDEPGCVNPKHLFLGTSLDNVRDRDLKNRQMKGEKNHLSKLTNKKVRIVRKMAERGNFTHQKIADKFGVTQATISKVIKRDLWRHVE